MGKPNLGDEGVVVLRPAEKLKLYTLFDHLGPDAKKHLYEIDALTKLSRKTLHVDWDG